MVHRKSEYQNEFKSSVAKKHQATYLENLTFRHHRREREFLHTPIGWWKEQEEEDELSSDSNETSENAKPKPAEAVEPRYQSLAEILAESSKKHEVFRQMKGKSTGEVDIDVGRISLDNLGNKDTGIEMPSSQSKDEALELNKDCKEKKTKTHDFPKAKLIDDDDSDREYCIEDKNKLMDKESRKSVTSDLKKHKCSKKSTLQGRIRGMGPKLTKSSGKPKRPDRQGVIPGTTGRPQSAVWSSEERPPFVSYGAGDIESTLAIHRTHNVRSSVDVYSQALKAQRMREAEKRRRQKEKIRAVKSANTLLDKLATGTPRDSQSWQSEYSKQFHGYDPQEYERAMSSRAVISHSTPISAVHRGGCLILHVD